MRESWARIFAGGAGPRVHITQQVAVSGMMLAVHSVHENFTLESDARAQVPMSPPTSTCAPPPGWRMIVHHASPAPAQAAADAAAGRSAEDLH